jgi:hypothetical protein
VRDEVLQNKGDTCDKGNDKRNFTFHAISSPSSNLLPE